jgi:hypothetical protein
MVLCAQTLFSRSIEAQKALPPLEATGGENKPNKKERKADKKNKAAAMAVDEVLPTEPETNVPRTSPERMDPDTSTGNMVALKDHVAELFAGTVHAVVCAGQFCRIHALFGKQLMTG